MVIGYWLWVIVAACAAVQAQLALLFKVQSSSVTASRSKFKAAEPLFKVMNGYGLLVIG